MIVLTINLHHPLETLAYSFPFADFIAASPGDSIASWFVESDDGITLSNAVLNEDLSITVDVSGGLTSNVYTVAAQVQTALGLSKRTEIEVRIRGDNVTGPRFDSGAITIVPGGILLDGNFILLDSNYLVLA